MIQTAMFHTFLVIFVDFFFLHTGRLHISSSLLAKNAKKNWFVLPPPPPPKKREKYNLTDHADGAINSQYEVSESNPDQADDPLHPISLLMYIIPIPILTRGNEPL